VGWDIRINGTLLGAAGGADRDTLIASELPAHTYGPGTFSITGGLHQHALKFWNNNNGAPFTLLRLSTVAPTKLSATNPVQSDDSMYPEPHSHPPSEWSGASAENSPNGGAHTLVQPTIILNYIIKL
jgi:microcystin-dependent protein